MRLLIMGPPGAGKGTQAVGIAAHYGVPAISSGALFRSNIQNKTPLGQRVSAIIAAGEYVPDDLTTELVFDRLADEDCAAGWLLDGYPRTAGQVEALDGLLSSQGDELSAAISLVAEPDGLVGRLLKRAEIEGRQDDNEETIRHRIEVYNQETACLLAGYQSRGLVVEVDALGEVADVTRRLTDALDAKLAAK
jgi:adenylate kinase